MARLHALLLWAAGLMLALSATVAAQDYPTKPARIVVPFPPGGINDIVGRLIATHLSERLGKQFIVDNRAGAGGVVGSEIVANAPKDGHTLLIVSLAGAVNPWLYKLPYDAHKAFAPIAILVSAPNLVSVHPDVPAKSVAELIALAKAKPGDLQYASSGVGTFLHLGGELFKLTAGIDILHVPFKGAGPAMVDVMGGHTKMVFASVTSSIAHIRSGKLRPLGVGARVRSPALPDVPTVAESGLPGYTAANWIGLVAPAGTPEPVIALLHKELAAIQDMPDVQKRLTGEGADVVRMGSAEFGAFMASETDKWGRVVKAGKITAR